MRITPALHVKNEEYWIGYVLRGLFRVFGYVIMLDTGSTDRTVEIARDCARIERGDLKLIVEDMQNDPLRIGLCSTRLREMVQSDWMLLVDGDEIWTDDALLALRDYPDPEGKRVCVINARNVREYGGSIMRADGWSADRLFGKGVRWNVRHDYPFQSYGLSSHLKDNLVHYIEDPAIWFWHVRHLTRSSQDNEACFRAEKIGYFPYNGSYEELPQNWMGEVNPTWPNPYLV